MSDYTACGNCGGQVSLESMHTRVVEHPKRGTQYACRPDCFAVLLRSARRSRAASTAGRARARKFTPESQRQAQAKRSHRSLSDAGRLGAQATLAAHGYIKLWRCMRQWRIEHPSEPERRFADRLKEWFGLRDAVTLPEPEGVLDRDFFREYEPFGGDEDSFMVLDFAWPYRSLAIEINGGVHREPRLDPDGKKAWRELQRLAMLEHRGWRVLVLQDTEIDNSREQVANFLGITDTTHDQVRENNE